MSRESRIKDGDQHDQYAQHPLASESEPSYISWENPDGVVGVVGVAGITGNDGPLSPLRWRSLSQTPAPRRVVLADDRMSADAAYRLACEGTALLWCGDYQNARQLLTAMTRRLERSQQGKKKSRTSPTVTPATPAAMAEQFHRYRLTQGQRARILGSLLLPFEPGHQLNLRRAPDVRAASLAAAGPDDQAYAASLRELLGIIGAYEWRKKGVSLNFTMTTLGGESRSEHLQIHPHYAVFSPVRGEYVDLLAQAPLPAVLQQNAQTLVMDIGTGTGVLAAVLARRGLRRIIATDSDPRALACAHDNIKRLQLQQQIEIRAAHLFPDLPCKEKSTAEAAENSELLRAGLIVCNPPWLPGRAASPLEAAIYDENSRMLQGWLQGLAARLLPGGEGWLILSDLAERLGLRRREELLEDIQQAGLQVIERHDTRPRHRRALEAKMKPHGPLQAARSAEITSLWRLAVKPPSTTITTTIS